jgi:hypothetical protein
LLSGNAQQGKLAQAFHSFISSLSRQYWRHSQSP